MILSALLLLLARTASAPDTGAAAPLAFTHVTVIDPASGAVRRDMTVLVEGSRISGVRPDSATGIVALPANSREIDARGKFLIPGLWDMHVHALFGDWVPGGREVILPLLLANGITGARDMGSDLEPILQAREATARGPWIGPRLVVSGPMLDGPKPQFPASIAVATPEDGRRAVAMLQGRGVDFIKLQSLVPREAYFAIADECRRRGMTFVGHVPDAIRASEASNAGQKSFEHLIGVFEGSTPAAFEDELLKGPKGPAKFLAGYDAGREAELIALLAKNRTWQCPTLLWEYGGWLVDVVDVTKYPELRYAPAAWREKTWPRFKSDMVKSYITDPLPVRQKWVEHELGIVARLHEAGVPMLAGTDAPPGVGVVPGMSLHRELARFVAAGLSPLEALQTATINPATFLDKTKDFGSVDAGKTADLVLLDANPLDDIANTTKIAAVVANGRLFTRADLDRILSDAEAWARSH
jgi:imidazolonepropionase-like amidohydrolase